MEVVLLPDAVVSERVPASSEEELGAWPDRPRLWRPRALLLLPKNVKNMYSTLTVLPQNIDLLSDASSDKRFGQPFEVNNDQNAKIGWYIKSETFHFEEYKIHIIHVHDNWG